MRRSLIFFVIGIVSGLGLGGAVLLATESQNSAGLVIQFGDGRVVTACVNLGSDGQATGEELLRAANLPLVLEGSGVGSAVCRIDSEGCAFPAEPCFCKCSLQPGQACQYWSYSKLVNNTWQYAPTGANSSVVHAGAVDGWAWGSGAVSTGAQPPLYTFEQICLATAATSTQVAAPSTTQQLPTAIPFSTELPTETSIIINILPTDTPTSTLQPTETPMPPTSVPIADTPTPTVALTPTAAATPTATVAIVAIAPTNVPSALPPATLLPTSSPLVVAIAASEPAPAIGVFPTASAAPIVLPLIQAAVATAPPSAILATAMITSTTVIMATAPSVVAPYSQETAPEPQDHTELMIILLAALLIAAWAVGAKNQEPRTKNK